MYGTVDEYGNTLIQISFEGDIDRYPPVFELPNGGAWKNIKQEIEDNKEGGKDLKISAEMNVPYGKDLPDRYNLDDTTDQGLRFPTAVKTYKKGSRTFYEFTRRYQSRKYKPYEIYYDDVDKELEGEIFEKGIFNVPQPKRTAYLSQLTPALHLSQLRTFYDVLGIMVLHNDITQDARKQMLKSAEDTIHETFTHDKLLEILARIDEKTITAEMDSITKEMDHIFISTFETHIRPEDGGLLKEFEKLLENERRTRTITDAVGGHEFHILLKMPGQIVVTNGIPVEDSLEAVYWKFPASALNDCEYVLHAVSVADN
jgi:Ca2+-binding EF-hand superfamily protein